MLVTRLSFWVLPEKQGQFERAYAECIAPFLEKRGFVSSPQRSRPLADGVFARLFECETATQLEEQRQALEMDPAFQALLDDLAPRFADAASRSKLRWELRAYRLPSGEGEKVPAGKGRTVPMGRGRGHWRIYDPTDGMASGLVNGIAQDPQGIMWFGVAQGGLVRFDSRSFETFTEKDGLPNHNISSAIVDRAGMLWIGTFSHHRKSGLVAYDGRRFTTYTTEDGLVSDLVQVLFEDRDGHLWIGTTEGLSRYDGRAFANFTRKDGLIHDSVVSIAQASDGTLWIGTQKGLSRWDGHALETCSNAMAPRDLPINALCIDADDHVWMGTRKGIYCSDGRSCQRYTTADGLIHDTVAAISRDPGGTLWIGTNGGISLYDGRGFANIEANDWVRDIYHDREGNTWVGTFSNVGRYDERHFLSFTHQDGLPDDIVWHITQAGDGALWFSTYSGACRYDGHFLTTYTTADGLSSNRVFIVCPARDGTLWIATMGGGLCRYDGQYFARLGGEGELIHHVFALHEDKEGVLWLGATDADGNDSLCRYDGSTFEFFTIADGVYGCPWCFGEDQAGRLWFGGGGGLHCYDDALRYFVDAEGLASDGIRGICEDVQGQLWIGTSRGLSRYNGECFVQFTTADGLADNLCWGVRRHGGELWIGGLSGGLSRYNGQVFQTLTREDGLVSNGVRSTCEDLNGDVWISTTQGVTRYRRPAPLDFSTVIDAIVADRRYDPGEEITIPADVELVAFEFHAVDVRTRSGGMVYLYRLQGHDSDWRQTRQNRVEYERLPLGEYTFEVRGVNRDLNYAQTASVQIQIRPNSRVEGLSQVLGAGTSSHGFIGESLALKRVQRQMAEVAPTELTVLVQGETGTGKGVAARTIHALSLCARGSFIPVNCGAIPEGLIESELFGHEKGSFTGAHARQLGKFELAQGGTLFLDEIGDLPLEGQRRLLQVLEERTFQRVGGKEILVADVRVVAATNRDLEREIEAGGFRRDLYYRLCTFVLRLPPLRQRRQDIPLLVEHFARRFAHRLDRPTPEIEPAVMAWLQEYHWPGNVRELEHVVQRGVLLCRAHRIEHEDVAVMSSAESDEAMGDSDILEWVQQSDGDGNLDVLERAEFLLLQAALQRSGGNRRQAARLLGVDRKKVERRLEKYGLEA